MTDQQDEIEQVIERWRERARILESDPPKSLAPGIPWLVATNIKAFADELSALLQRRSGETEGKKQKWCPRCLGSGRYIYVTTDTNDTATVSVCPLCEGSGDLPEQDMNRSEGR